MPACIYCHRSLPSNDVVEVFPFARRVAYDPKRLRYWTVCSKCGKWTLAPIDDDERAAAIDQFERWWRSSSTHYSTGGIGLGQYSPTFSLVRVGEWNWTEFAAWRHASVLRRRWRRSLFNSSWMTGGAVTAWYLNLIPATDPVIFGTMAFAYGAWFYGKRRPICRVPTPNGGRTMIRSKHAFQAELVRRADGWALNTQHDQGASALTGEQGIRALGYVMPMFNGWGARERTIRDALELVTEAGGPEALAARAADPVPRGTRHYTETATLRKYKPVVRIALEMATQEDNERRQVDGELALLRAEWQEAEEIATIAGALPWRSYATLLASL